LPGTHYCGPWTDVPLGTDALSDLDHACRIHDLDYDNPDITTREADEKFVHAIVKLDGVDAAIVRQIIKLKGMVDRITDTDRWLRKKPGRKLQVKMMTLMKVLGQMI
jgi:hypothetical protein